MRRQGKGRRVGLGHRILPALAVLSRSFWRKKTVEFNRPPCRASSKRQNSLRGKDSVPQSDGMTFALSSNSILLLWSFPSPQVHMSTENKVKACNNCNNFPSKTRTFVALQPYFAQILVVMEFVKAAVSDAVQFFIDYIYLCIHYLEVWRYSEYLPTIVTSSSCPYIIYTYI